MGGKRKQPGADDTSKVFQPGEGSERLGLVASRKSVDAALSSTRSAIEKAAEQTLEKAREELGVYEFTSKVRRELQRALGLQPDSVASKLDALTIEEQIQRNMKSLTAFQSLIERCERVARGRVDGLRNTPELEYPDDETDDTAKESMEEGKQARGRSEAKLDFEAIFEGTARG